MSDHSTEDVHPMGPRAGVAIVGGGPAGMTAALLLARAGHGVDLYEAGEGLGGLWASRLDSQGRFRGDNSCKVYQHGYHTAPALFRMIGTDWSAHFTQRHNLGADWLRPFIRDSSARDLALLGRAYVWHRLGRGNYHQVSVLEFMRSRGLSDACQRWMRATALGGIAGTLRMTMWELFHRIGSNLSEIFKGADGPLFWNSQPPNRPGGFVALWTQALVDAGVRIHTQTPVRGVHRSDGGQVSLDLGEAGSEGVDTLFLAVPPPALARIMAASDDVVVRGTGMGRAALQATLRSSVYTHVGISWFFDQPLPRDLPLGGHTVRQGWHPILVQHDQYQGHLPPGCKSVVTGSVAVDTDLRHHRLGTQAREHTPEALARIIWEDEQRADPTLPSPVDIELMGSSSATQVVQQGPLPLALGDLPIFLATNLHGQAPYFTASLESAMQAGAIAAQTFAPAVERLPMGRPAPGGLPWVQTLGPGSDTGVPNTGLSPHAAG